MQSEVKDIAIYGAGGFGREVACLIKHINNAEDNQWNLIGFFDDNEKVWGETKYGPVFGGLSALNAYDKPLSVVFAIGSPKVIKHLVENVHNPLISFPNLIAPNVLFFDKDSTTLGKGNIITFGCRLSCNTVLGDFNVLNGCVSIGHDANIGNYNVFMPEARVSGEVCVQDLNLFGARSFVAQQLKVGTNSVIGAGSIILRKVKDNSLYIGNPAKKIEI